jgi:hypothetical protein
MAKYFSHLNGITVSEFQMINTSLRRNCDYQIALRIVRDELKAKKEKERYWIVGHDRAWLYFSMNFKDTLRLLRIDTMDKLIEFAKLQFEKGMI